jgi:hypothetical protein
MHICKLFLLYQDISVWKEENLKDMVVFQMTAAATVISNMLHTPTCGVFFLQKRCISENMAYLYKLSMIIVRIILALYMVWNSCVIICLLTDMST